MENQEYKKIKGFTDLNAWKEGHKLAIIIYTVTQDFPREEMFGITNQMRRCAVSITSNIAEGFSRNTLKDKKQFYAISLGSVTELQSQLMIAKDVKYIKNETFQQLHDQTVTTHKIINGLIKSLNNKINA